MKSLLNLRGVSRLCGIRKMGTVSHHAPVVTMNSLPVPSGSWAEGYAQKQKTSNLILLSGILCFVGSIFAANSGLIQYGTGPKIGK